MRWRLIFLYVCFAVGLIACGQAEVLQSNVQVALPAEAEIEAAVVVRPEATVISTVEPTVWPQMTATAVPSEEVSEEVVRLVPDVLAVYDHDPAAFTQGLLWYEGGFYESTGLYGESSVRRTTLDGTVVQFLPVDAAYFSEGLALVDGRLIQLTWQSQMALVYDRETLTEIGRFAYEGEGWGICFSQETGTLWMSDGSSRLVEREVTTFEPIREIEVLLEGEPVVRLNELECVGEYIYANVWLSDLIMQIERESGRVSAVVEAHGLLTAEERDRYAIDGVLNGIAYDVELDLFYLTGKRWPKLFGVRFVPKGGVD